MSRDPNGPRQHPADFQSQKADDDALLRWDELDEQLLGMLAEDPERGRRLRKLQDADGWLRARAAEAARRASPALLECPPSEELYDFGQGPGASTLSAGRREAIDRHLATCRECEAYVHTLTVAPPPPLILGLPEEDLDSEPQPVPAWIEPSPLRPVRRKGPRRMVFAMAAAAAVVVVVGIQSITTTPKLGFPEAPVLRGSDGGPILYPREHVLMPSDQLRTLFPALGSAVTYQVEPQAEASEYRFEFTRHEPGAFGKDLETKSLVTKQTTGVAPIPLTPGHFTLKAWAVVNGLDQRLGSRDFDILTDPVLEAQLLALASKPEPERTMSALTLLHDQGYVSDARSLARTLPASEARDRFLGQVPGR